MSLTRLLLSWGTPLVLVSGRYLAQRYLRTWGRRRLSWYDHYFDYLRGPEHWYWLERGIVAADYVRSGDRVLDLCCGDGSYSGIFLAPKADAVDAMDISAEAIDAARQRWQRPNTNFQVGDVLRDPFARPRYDVVLLLAGLEYFSPDEGQALLQRIAGVVESGKGVLIGCTPVWGERPGYSAGQRSHVTTVDELRAVLAPHFQPVKIFRGRDPSRPLYYFVCGSGTSDRGPAEPV